VTLTPRPTFVVEDQSATLAFLERALAPAKRIDTHGAVVFLSGERAYKLKRAVRFPYMDFSTAPRRREMCEAEIAINRRLAPKIYLGVTAIRRAAGGAMTLGALGEAPDDAVDWLVTMRRFDEDGLLDRMAARGALTPALVSALGARIAAFHNGLAPVIGPFCSPAEHRHSIEADIREMRAAGERLDPAASEALAHAMPPSLEPHLDLVVRRLAAGAVRRCHGDLHLRNIVMSGGTPVPFDAIEFSDRIAIVDVL